MGLLALFLGVVVALKRVEFPLILTNGFELADELVGLALWGADVAFVAGDTVDGFEDEDRVRGDEGTSRFRNDVGQRDAAFLADLLDVSDDVAGVAFHAVIHGGFVGRATAIVIDAQTAADVEQAHGEAHALEFAVKTGGFDDGFLDCTDVRHL